MRTQSNQNKGTKKMEHGKRGDAAMKADMQSKVAQRRDVQGKVAQRRGVQSRKARGIYARAGHFMESVRKAQSRNIDATNKPLIGGLFMTGSKAKRAMVLYAALVLMSVFGTTTVFAKDGGDPLTVVNNLSTFIFGLIRAIGMILLGFGIVQVGLSLKSHDPSQRANGFLTLAGGVIITFAKEILTLITGA